MSAGPGGGAGGPVRRPDVRLLPSLALAWGAAWWGTGAGSSAAGSVHVAAAGVGCLALGGLVAPVARRRHRRSAHRGAGWWSVQLRRSAPALVVALAVAGLVLAATAARCAARYRPPLPGWAADRAVAELRAHVVDDPHPVSGGRFGGPPQVALRVEAERVTGRGREVATGAPLLLLGTGAWAGVSAGQSVVAVGRLAPAEPGDDVVALLTALGPPREVIPGSWPWQVTDRLRAGLRRACEGLGPDAGGLLPSLVVGDTSRLPERLRTDLQTAGLTHVTAVSRANVAIAAGAALWLATALGAGRRARVALTAAVLVGFVVVARPQPSVLRAAAMGGVAPVGLVAGRTSRGVPVLAAAGVVLLVVDPWLSRSAGFMLSCLATGGLLLLAPLWARSLRRVLPEPLAMGLAVPAAAQAACGPVLVLLQPSVSLVSVPANLLAEPAVAPATVLGLLAAALAPVSPPAAHAVAWLGALATGWICEVAHPSAAAPFAAVPWPPGGAGALLLTLLTGVVVVATTGAVRRRGRDDGPGPPTPPDRAGRADRAGRRGRGLPAGALGLAVLLAVVAGWWAGPRLRAPGGGAWPPGGWLVAQCDVGQGAALVARSGADRAVVVDVGPDPAAMDACLRRLGVRHLDLLLLTHYHADHVQGLTGALRGRDVGTVLASPLEEPAENAAAVRSALQAVHRTVRAGWAGMSGDVGVGTPGEAPGKAAGEAAGGPWSVQWRLLEPADPPPGTMGSGATSDDGTLINEASLAYVLDVRGPAGALRVAGLGDLETDGQHRLLGELASGHAGTVAPVDVVEVAHHGSARQVPELYASLLARIGLIGVGAGNDYGHPASSALAMLRSVGTTAFRTDVDGGIALVAGPDGALTVVTSTARDPATAGGAGAGRRGRAFRRGRPLGWRAWQQQRGAGPGGRRRAPAGSPRHRPGRSRRATSPQLPSSSSSAGRTCSPSGPWPRSCAERARPTPRSPSRTWRPPATRRAGSS